MIHSGPLGLILVVVVVIAWVVRQLFMKKGDPSDIKRDTGYQLWQRKFHSTLATEVVAQRMLQFEEHTMYTIESATGNSCIISQPASFVTPMTRYALDMRQTATGTDIEFGPIIDTALSNSAMQTNRMLRMQVFPGLYYTGVFRNMRRLKHALRKYVK